MANDLFPLARSAFARGELDWEGDNFTALLLDAADWNAGYEFQTDLVATTVASAALAGKTVLTGGVCDADNTTVTGLAGGETALAIVIIQDTGTPATSRVVYYADTNDDTTPISLAGDGSAVVLNWSAAASRVFRL
jgi:hypothetical protein